MIVAIKRNKNGKFLKIILVLAILIGCLIAYKVYTDKVLEQQQMKEYEMQKALKIQKEKEEKELLKEKEAKQKKEIEEAILSEIEKAIDLIGRENIQNAKLIDDKIIFICEPSTNLEPLIVRYGAMALIKKNLNETIVAVDVNFILKSRASEK